MKYFTAILALLATASFLSCTSQTNNVDKQSCPRAATPKVADFKVPPQDVRPICYWWWVNGHVDKKTITADLQAMKNLGFGGFLLFDARGYWEDSKHLLYPKPKCEFMDNQWRENFAFAMREAARLGLSASANLSSCAGRLKGPWEVGADAPKRLICKITPLKVGAFALDKSKPADRKYFWDVARFAVKYDGKEFAANDKWLNAGDGLYTMMASSGKRLDDKGVTEHRNALKCVDISGLDKWEVPADGQWAEVRLASTTFDGHDFDVDVLDRNAVAGHYRRMADALKKDLGSLFGTTLSHFYSVSWEGAVPTWSNNFPQDFKKFAGYDIEKWLPVLAGFNVDGKADSAKFMTDFRRARNKTFRANFYTNMADLARADGLQWHAESGGPWVRSAPVFGEADQLEFLSDNDMPQGEFWVGKQFKKTGGRYLVKPIANAANIYGKDKAAIEAFTHMNRHWSSYPAMLKIAADFAFADGCNALVWHTFTASPEEFGKPGIEYFAGTHVNQNVTWHPFAAPFIEYLARCQYMLTRGKNVADICVYTGDNPYQHWGNWQDTPFKGSKLKIPDGFKYDIANNDVLLNRAKVVNGRLDFGAGTSYGALIVDLQSPLVSPQAIAKILELQAQGLPVAAVGERPQASATLGESSVLVAELGKKLFDKAKTPAEIFASLKPDVATKFEFTHRKAGNVDIYFLRGNGKDSPIFRNAGTPTIWNALDGSVKKPLVVKKTDDNRTQIELDFPENGSAFVVFGSDAKAEAQTQATAQTSAQIATPWNIEFEPNRGAPASAVFDKLSAWNESQDKGIKYFSGIATYKNKFTLTKEALKKPIRLNLGEVAVIAQVFVNGKDCGITWTAPYEVDISAAAKAGENTLEIKVANTWENRLIGDAALPESARITKSNMRLYKGKRTNSVYSGFASEEELSPSGLIGPVSISH